MTMIRNTALACLAGVFLMAQPGPAEAACDKTCRETKARNAAIWKTRSKVTVNGQDYLVAIAPQKAYALVGWDSSVKTITLTGVEAAASAASGCKGKDESILSMLSGPRDTPIQTKVFRKMDSLRIELKC